MADCAFMYLRAARDARNIKRWQVAKACSVSEDTIRRWEVGEVKPSEDDVDRFAVAVGDHLLWHRWMCQYESYRRRYAVPRDYALPLAVMDLGHQISDVCKLQDKVERDVIDGVIDDRILAQQYRKEVQEVGAACAFILQHLDRMEDEREQYFL